MTALEKAIGAITEQQNKMERIAPLISWANS